MVMGVPGGEVTKFEWESEIFSDTRRNYWLYVPAQYDASEPAGMMVFQDGYSYLNDFEVPEVFDRLVHQRIIPPLIGLFVNPGHRGGAAPDIPWSADNRSFEYDILSDQYVRFLIEEIIPEVSKEYNLADSAKMRAIAGISSGGICAFTAAWERPDYFHKVLSHVGSFTNINGGHAYPSLIRRSSKRDIRVFLQTGSNDLDTISGNWWLSNLQMESALKFRDYDHKFVGGTGEHDSAHGKEILPETLEWLWR